MSRWWTQMPAGMFRKSEGFASRLADPTGRYTLQQLKMNFGTGRVREKAVGYVPSISPGRYGVFDEELE